MIILITILFTWYNMVQQDKSNYKCSLISKTILSQVPRFTLLSIISAAVYLYKYIYTCVRLENWLYKLIHKSNIYLLIYNIIEHVCVCLFVCLSSRLKKFNTTGAASVKPGEAREMIGAANLRQKKFCQMKFAKWSFTRWSSPNKVSPNKKSFGHIATWSLLIKTAFGRFNQLVIIIFFQDFRKLANKKN